VHWLSGFGDDAAVQVAARNWLSEQLAGGIAHGR